MAGDNHHAVQEHKINMLQSTGLTSGNTAIAGPTYTFHPTNVIIVSTIGQSDYSSCESRDQSRSRGAGCRLLLLLLSRGDDGSKPYGYDFATTLDHLKKSNFGSFEFFFLKTKILLFCQLRCCAMVAIVSWLKFRFILTSMTQIKRVLGPPRPPHPSRKAFFSLFFAKREREACSRGRMLADGYTEGN
jgi:hypothetical protein